MTDELLQKLKELENKVESMQKGLMVFNKNFEQIAHAIDTLADETHYLKHRINQLEKVQSANNIIH